MASGWSWDPTKDQQRYYELLGDVYAYEPSTSRGLLILHRKVGYAVCGVPDEEPSCGNNHTGYSEAKRKTIKDIVSVIKQVHKENKKRGDEIYMATIFVFVEHQQQVLQYPVFRVLLTETSWKFVDTNCRVYSSWNDFLKCNELPKGKLCSPLDGVYSGDLEDQVELQWGITPAAELSKKVMDAADVASEVTALVASGVIAFSWFTPLVPAVAIASTCAAAVSGVYTAIRKGSSLVDRGSHGQTVNPFSDHQVTMSWLSMASSVVDVASGAVAGRAAYLASKGRAISKTGRITCNTLRATSIVINIAEVGIGYIGERFKKDKATPLGVFQFSAALLFFTHATVNFETASRILKEAENGVIDAFEESVRSNRRRKQSDKLTTLATGESVLDGNSRVIRGIRSVDSLEDFCAGIIRTRKDTSDHKAIFSAEGSIVVNGGTEIYPLKLYQLRKPQRKELLKLAKQASQGTISYATLLAHFDSILGTYSASSTGNNTSDNNDVMEALNTLTSQLQQEIPGTTIGRNEVTLMMLVVDDLTVSVCWRKDKTYAKWWHLVWSHVSKIVTEMADAYDEALSLEKQLHKYVDKGCFNLEQGILMTNLFMHFVCTAYNRYKDNVEELTDATEKIQPDNILCPQCKQVLI